MSKEVDLDLFARLMRLSSGPRTDLLEYVGQAPALTEDLVKAAECARADKPSGQNSDTQ